jgi:carbon storage regulator
MLYLSRKVGESIIINNDIELTVVEVKGRTVKIGFNFPPSASVLRKEIFENIRAQNLAASQSGLPHDIGMDDLLNALHGLPTLSTPALPATNSDEE